MGCDSTSSPEDDASVDSGADAVVRADASCDPAAPQVTGTLDFPDSVTPSDWATLEIRLIADGETGFARTHDVREISFPFAYDVGGGLGFRETPNWEVVAFLTNRSDADTPDASEPTLRASVTFACDQCGSGCGGSQSIELVAIDCGETPCGVGEYCLLECLCCGAPSDEPPASRGTCLPIPAGCSSEVLCECDDLESGLCEEAEDRVLRPCA
ncbi:MAG: hypothetical protein AAGE52_07025 [Myxococcota bacterium]